MKTLTTEHKREIANKFGIEYRSLCAVMAVESAGSGFDSKTGLIKIQFEPYWFQKYTGKRIPNGVENQLAEWKAYKAACEINPLAAMKATSWGLGQIMGFNHEAAGYAAVEEMVNDFEESEYNQLVGMLRFIKAHPKMMLALESKDWATFAYHYNGPAYKNFDYDTKLEKAYERAAV